MHAWKIFKINLNTSLPFFILFIFTIFCSFSFFAFVTFSMKLFVFCHFYFVLQNVDMSQVRTHYQNTGLQLLKQQFQTYSTKVFTMKRGGD